MAPESSEICVTGMPHDYFFAGSANYQSAWKCRDCQREISVEEVSL